MPDFAQQLFDAAQARVPAALRAAVENHWRGFRDQLPRLPRAGVEQWLGVLSRVFAASDFVARNCVQYPQVLGDLIESGELFRSYEHGEIARRVEREIAHAPDEAALKLRLRQLRRREMLRLAWRDLAGWAGLTEVLAATTELAEACLGAALAHLYAWAAERHGMPLGAASGRPVELVVLGLGKLGGRELNVSSDIDLIFAYAEDGETRPGDGAQGLSNHEFFVRLGQRLIAALSETTTDGFVFRVDLRLRPHGASGPLALSFDALEQYYQIHGREWERYALIKARAVAGDRAGGESLLKRLRPFVYRKYLDYGAFEAMRAMKALIEREVSRKGLQANIKLGPGGIREIEFIVQALQLIRGGREPLLQEPQLLGVLPLLAARGYLAPVMREELAAAYVFLRTVEHRLQMVNDSQTQTLPHEPLECERLAFAAGYPDWPAFERELIRHRGLVHGHFTGLFRSARPPGAEPVADALAGVWLGSAEPEAGREALRQAGYREPQPVVALLEGLRRGPACRVLSSEGRERLDRLVPLLLAAAGQSPDPDTTFGRLVNLLEAIGRRSAYLALLIENPPVLTQLVQLSASSWVASWIARHPILLDELIDPRSLYELPTPESLAAGLRSRLSHIPQEDEELQMEVLREFRHGHVLHVAAAAIARGASAFGEGGRALPGDVDSRGGPAPEAVGTQLTWIAETVLTEGLGLAADALTARHGAPRCPGSEARAGFAVIGYGRLGSGELGYASDLDMIFIYEGCEDGASDGTRSLPNEVYFARLGQRLIHILTTRTPGGILYEVDMRLRPSGKSGPLVTTLAAFREYQQDRAWVWEHQALVRARPVAGDPELARAFARVREEILCRARDPQQLKREVREMRTKMREAHGGHSPGPFDLKHDRGGMIDIEFMVQYWVLRWAHDHPVLTRDTGNIPVLEALHHAGLLDAGRRELLVGAYRRYLSAEQRLKLMERGSRSARAELGDLPERVERVWREVFE